jgi:hypothetical protein
MSNEIKLTFTIRPKPGYALPPLTPKEGQLDPMAAYAARFEELLTDSVAAYAFEANETADAAETKLYDAEDLEAAFRAGFKGGWEYGVKEMVLQMPGQLEPDENWEDVAWSENASEVLTGACGDIEPQEASAANGNSSAADKLAFKGWTRSRLPEAAAA